ncbi:MAG: sigma-70 family RNA polymerase sigma factor [Thermoguttaceae bacterium]
MTKPGPQRLSRLLRERGPALVLYAQQWCRNPEDVVQEAFLQLVEEPAEPANVVAWLYRVVRHRALNASRSAARRTRRESAAALPGEAWFEPSQDPLVADEASAALRQLPLEQREVIVARLWGGLSFEEVAEVTGLSLSTAYRRYQAGIEALRERLGVECPENETPQT